MVITKELLNKKYIIGFDPISSERSSISIAYLVPKTLPNKQSFMSYLVKWVSAPREENKKDELDI